jgi:RpiB/LacA/LacB family sugar-phosphate isomerase
LGGSFGLFGRGPPINIQFMKNLPVFIAADHRGVKLKAELIAWLKKSDYEVGDLGTDTEERCDALDFASKMAKEFKSDQGRFGVLICGTGHAMAMTANRYKNIRAILGLNVELARLAREHNDANVLVLASDFTDVDAAEKILEVFLKTQCLGGRYAERRDRLTELGGL